MDNTSVALNSGIFGGETNGLKSIAITSKNDDKSLDRFKREYVIYDFEGKKGLWLSKKQRVLCEAWLESNGNYAYAGRVVRGMFGIKTSDCTIKRWLGLSHVQEYLIERVKEKGLTNGYTKDRWLLEAVEYRDGVRKANGATAKMHELIGKAMGWLSEQVNTFNAEKQIINFVQADGKE